MQVPTDYPSNATAHGGPAPARVKSSKSKAHDKHPVAAVAAAVLGSIAAPHATDVPFFSPELNITLTLKESQKKLIQNLLSTWALGDKIALWDLLGLQVSHLLRSNIPDRSQGIFTEIYLSFEACFFVVWMSLNAESTACHHETFLDCFNEDIMPNVKQAWKFFESFKLCITLTDAKCKELTRSVQESSGKLAGIKQYKLTALNKYQEHLRHIKEIVDLIHDLICSEDYLDLLLDNTIDTVFEQKIPPITDIEKSLEHYRLLAEFHHNLFVSAKLKKYCGLEIHIWKKYISDFPTTASEKTLLDLSRRTLVCIHKVEEICCAIQENFEEATDGTLDVHAYTKSLVGKKKDYLASQEELIAETFSKYNQSMIALLCLLNIHAVTIQDLLPLIAPNYKSHIDSFYQMVRSFNTIYSRDSPFESKILAPSSLVSEEVNQELNRIGTQLYREFTPELQKVFAAHCASTKKSGYYIAASWTFYFDLVRPIVSDGYETIVQGFKKLQEENLKAVATKMQLFSTREEKMQCLKDYEEDLYNKSLPVCQLICLYIDIRHLMSLDNAALKQKEGFSLPQEVFEFLELEGAEKIVEAQLAALPKATLETEILKKGKDKALEIPTVSKPSTKQHQKKPPATPEEATPLADEAVFKVKRGEKRRKMEQRIRDTYKEIPERIADHIIYPGGATLPKHRHVAMGTMKSFVAQMEKAKQKKNRLAEIK